MGLEPRTSGLLGSLTTELHLMPISSPQVHQPWHWTCSQELSWDTWDHVSQTEGAQRVVHQLKAWTALPEDLGSILSIHRCRETKLPLGRHIKRQRGSPWQTYHQSPIWSTSFIGVTYRNMGRLLKGSEVTQRQLHQQGAPQHERQLTKLGTWNTLHSLQAAQRFGECLFWGTLV